MIYFKLLLTLIGLMLLICCKKEDVYTPPSDPSEAILGKWEIIEMGDWPTMELVKKSTGYKEYLRDSILREYDYETKVYSYNKYWIDSVLHVGIIREDGVLVTRTYKYQFYDDKLRLDINAFAIYTTSIFKRIN